MSDSQFHQKILWINPVATDIFDKPMLEMFQDVKAPFTRVDVVSFPPIGPKHLEYSCYEMMIMPELMKTVRRAEEQGYDAAVIGCFYDPALRAAREVANKMVVTAPAESCLRLAATLGDTVSIIVGRRKWVPEMRENVHKYGYKDKLASFKVLGMGVHDFQKDHEETKRQILQAAQEAVEKDGAEVVVLGCTIEFGFYQEVQRRVGVPVLDATIAPLKYAEYLIGLRNQFGWGHSKIAGFEAPPEQEISEWSLFE
ncbi:aspartate/glutamate racemase family protein [Alicyclobacillus fastidiosus]|uniref:Aspartate/glutamate racemase family protein n=1 Tax=Alicyclobacillus fastidiosus TaxID=392011 RepID=A0ABY6ZA27_9BACL|nr:aspartate/glutamate racemase family protein [Alicyclobacillus fastidiosus]WAH39735.1 aspartate/glutamate racemase family protein [Alicyclobacillus fastidiosus]GMA60966.1 hydantoin racemase [Alicyclobacillus fastidiosus]